MNAYLIIELQAGGCDGLGNLLFEVLCSFSSSLRSKQIYVALLFLEVNQFKQFGGSYMHVNSSVTFAQRLQRVARQYPPRC